MRNTSNKIRQITDGAVITALYCAFLLISRFTGSSLEYELFFIMPIPVAIYAFKYDFKTSWIPGLSVTLLSIFLTINPLNSAVYIFPSILIGIIYGGILAKKNIRPILCILFITVLSFISELLSSVILSKFLGISDIFNEIGEITTNIGLFFEKMSILSFDIPLLQAIMEGVIPSILLLIALIDAVLVYLLFNLIVLKSRLFERNDNYQGLKFTKAPMWLSIVYLASFPLAILSLIYFTYNNQIIHFLIVFCVNLHIILTMVYLYFGVKTIALFCRIKRKIWILIISYMCVFIFPFLYLVSFVGTADSFYGISEKLINNNIA